jgi:hypothetical protein
LQQRNAKGSEAAVDYLTQLNGHLIPIEVKSSEGGHLKSMHLFLDSHPKTPYGIRLSTQHYSVHEKICSYPLYAVPSSIQWKVPVTF